MNHRQGHIYKSFKTSFYNTFTFCSWVTVPISLNFKHCFFHTGLWVARQKILLVLKESQQKSRYSSQLPPCQESLNTQNLCLQTVRQERDRKHSAGHSQCHRTSNSTTKSQWLSIQPAWYKPNSVHSWFKSNS